MTSSRMRWEGFSPVEVGVVVLWWPPWPLVFEVGFGCRTGGTGTGFRVDGFCEGGRCGHIES